MPVYKRPWLFDVWQEEAWLLTKHQQGQAIQEAQWINYIILALPIFQFSCFTKAEDLRFDILVRRIQWSFLTLRCTEYLLESS